MAVVVGIFIGGALLVTLAATVFTDIKIFGLAREQRRAIPAATRRQADRMMIICFVLTWGHLAFLFVIAPLGRKDTVIWFLIVPFLIFVPLGTILAGIRGYRLGRHPNSGEARGERPKGQRTPCKYGGSLGWVASMMDPETSSWKPTSGTKDKAAEDGPEEAETDDCSSS